MKLLEDVGQFRVIGFRVDFLPCRLVVGDRLRQFEALGEGNPRARGRDFFPVRIDGLRNYILRFHQKHGQESFNAGS